jgi:hypothetical protein
MGNIEAEARALPENLRMNLARAAVLLAADEMLRVAVVDRLYHGHPELRGDEALDADEELSFCLDRMVALAIFDEHDAARVLSVHTTAISVRRLLSDVHLRWVDQLGSSVFRDAHVVLAKAGVHWAREHLAAAGAVPDPETILLDGHTILLQRLLEASELF